MANQIVAGEIYETLTGQLFELGRQLRQSNGYPFDPIRLKAHLQAAIEGRWINENVFRETGELSIQIPALPQPTLNELRSKYQIRSIESDSSPTDAVTLKLATVLRENEGSISGKEYERRIAGKPILGYQQAAWLVEHQDEFPDFMTILGEIYIDFSGLVVLDANGHRRVPYLHERNGRWRLHLHGLAYDFTGSARIASSHK